MKAPYLENAILRELANGPGTVVEIGERLRWGGGSVPVLLTRMFQRGLLAREMVLRQRVRRKKHCWLYSLPAEVEV